MIRLAALAMLLLAGCDDMRVARRGEVAAAELNARLALDRAERLERRVSDLEEKARRDAEDFRAMDRAIGSDLGSIQNTMNDNVDLYNAHLREYRQHTH